MSGGRLGLLLSAAALLTGCSTGSGVKKDAASGDVVTVDSPAAAQAAVGRRVRISGQAGNAKLAAAVVQGELVVYCMDKESWPDELSGKGVTIEGTLEHTSQYQAQTAPSGEVSQGTSGPVFLVRACTLPK